MTVRSACCWLILLPACTASAPLTGSMMAPTQMKISGLLQAYESAIPAMVQVIFGEPPVIQVSLGGASADGERWSAYGQLSDMSVTDGASLALSSSPLKNGEASVQVSRAVTTPAIFAQSGTLSFSLVKGRISGTATAEPGALGASFVGNFVVSCMVPRSALPGGPPSGGGTAPSGPNDPEPLVPDDKLESPSCAPWRAISQDR
jgi:hypothetical protein